MIKKGMPSLMRHFFLIAGLLTACIGGVKELLDKVAGGVPSWADFWFTLAGGAIGLLIASLYLI